jgi:hypothetical protein
VTFETDPIKSLEQTIESRVVFDIVGKDVLVGGAPTGTMYAQQPGIILEQTSDGQLIEKRDPSLASILVRPGEIESVSGPEGSLTCELIEIHRLRAACEIMIPQKNEGTFFLNHIDARQGVRTVSNDVTETDDFIDRA